MVNIITLTANPALDLYAELDRVRPNEKLRLRDVKKDPGGGGVNVARVIHRLGDSARAIFARGGFTGDLHAKLLDREGVECDPLNIQNEMRQSVSVLETDSGDLYRFGYPGAELSESEYQALLDKVADGEAGGFLVASGSLPPGVPDDFYARLSERARQRDLRFVLDTSGPALAEGLRGGAYLVKPNRKELADLAGRRGGTDAETEEILRGVLADYPVEVIVLSLGPEGAMLATADGIRHFPAAEVETVSTIGAGDSMVAGIVYQLARGEELEAAVRYGIACGASTLKSPGTELLDPDDVAEIYASLTSQNGPE